MPELSALPLGRPAIRDRTTRQAPRPRLRGPGRQTQASRLDPTFARLTAAFDAQRVAVADEPAAHESDLVLVLEVAGELDDFVSAVRRVDGLEFLADQLEDEVDPDDFAAVGPDGRRRRYAREIFLVASDHSAWTELLSLWNRFKRGDPFPHGFAKFRHLFERLRELRLWDDRDRLELGGAKQVWERELGQAGSELVHFETELWWRSDSSRRADGVNTIRTEIERVGGRVVATCELEEIAYHGVLCMAPAELLLQAAATDEVRWLSTWGVRVFHAAGQFAVPMPHEVDESPAVADESAHSAEGEPRLALLDGLPVGNHQLLVDRLVIDDVEGWSDTIPVKDRVHGTAMASLIIYGDLGDGGTGVAERIYVRPIIRSYAPDWVLDAREELPRNRLPVDLLHASVARLFEGERVAPRVRVILLAVGDISQPFDRFVSPLARLVDWLSFKYGVVFLVAGGNHLGQLQLRDSFDPNGDDQEIQREFLVALIRSAAFRRPLAPAEAVNAITVGAAHSDRSDFVPDGSRLDPFASSQAAAVISPIGPGVRRGVKPEVLLPGGRQLVQLDPAQNASRSATPVLTTRAPGIRAAAPGSGATALSATSYCCGTSGATALAGHEILKLLSEIDEARVEFGDLMPDAEFDAVLAKAALVHNASWGAAGADVLAAFNELQIDGQRDRVARVLGYGLAKPTGTFACHSRQATVFAAGLIAEGQAHAYTLPLPPSLSGIADRRRVTLTLAWLTPVNPGHRAYRRAALTLDPQGADREVLGDTTEITRSAARRGTIQHEVLEGSRAVPYARGAAVELVVSCRADAGALEVAIPYALLATVEVPLDVDLPIYEEVRQALRVPVRVEPGP